MAWEKRGKCGPYYTRSRREGGRVVREYVGRGRVAEAVAEADRVLAEAGEELRRQEREKRAAEAELERLWQAYSVMVAAALRGALEAAGYHQHQRGEWRRKRGQKQEGAGNGAG